MTFKALRFSRFGPVRSVLSIEELPQPEVSPGEVLVQVAASAINPSDVKNVTGSFPHTALPRTPGRDFAGRVASKGEWAGAEVWGTAPGLGFTRDGTHAQYVVVPSESLSRKPESLSMEQAAAVGVPYLAAWSGLIEAARLQSGETVLIVGVSGAVGRAATQIAQWKHAEVIGADRSSENRAGADSIINTSTSDLREEVMRLTGGRGVDVALDAVGGPMFEPVLRSLALHGRHVAITSTGERRVCFDLLDFYHNLSQLHGIDTLKLTSAEIGAFMDEFSDGFERGMLEPPEVQTWPLEKAVEAYEAVESGKAEAKQVLVP